MIDIAHLDDDLAWRKACELYHDGEIDLLVELLRSEKTIPEHVGKVLADVIEGKLKPSMRGKTRGHRLTYLQKESIYLHVKRERERWRTADPQELAEWISAETDGECLDASEVREHGKKEVAALKAALAKKHGITVAAIEKIIQRFPR